MKAGNDNENRADLPNNLLSRPGLKVKDSMISQNQNEEYELVHHGSNIISPTVSKESEIYHSIDNSIEKPLQNAIAQPTMAPQVIFSSNSFRNDNSFKEVKKNKFCIEEPIKNYNTKENVKHSCALDALTNTNYLDKKKKKKGIFGNIWRKKNKNKNKEHTCEYTRNDISFSKKSKQTVSSNKGNNFNSSGRFH